MNQRTAHAQMKCNDVSFMICCCNDTSSDLITVSGLSPTSSASARIVLVQVVLQGVPAPTYSHHHVTSQDLGVREYS